MLFRSQDWQYYTLTFPVADYKQLSREQIVREMDCSNRTFYSPGRIGRRLWASFWRGRHPIVSLVSNLSYRRSLRANHRAYQQFTLAQEQDRHRVAMH